TPYVVRASFVARVAAWRSPLRAKERRRRTEARRDMRHRPREQQLDAQCAPPKGTHGGERVPGATSDCSHPRSRLADVAFASGSSGAGGKSSAHVFPTRL